MDRRRFRRVRPQLLGPEAHVEADMLERSKLYNWVNIIGSFTNLALLAIALGVSYAIGWNTNAENLKSCQVLRRCVLHLQPT